MPAPRVALTALALAGGLALSGCGNLVTRDLTPPQASPSQSGSSSPAATRSSSPTAGARASSSSTPSTSTSASTPSAATTASPSPVPASTAGGIIAQGLVTPPASAAIKAGTFAIGDSFLLGSARVLKANKVRVDAKVGRQFFEGINVLKAVSRAGSLPRNLVVHLGTNGSVTSKQCDSVFNYAGPDRRVFFVTVIGPRSWMKPDDVVIKKCVARHATQAVLIDWAGVSASHPEYFGPDRVHPNPKGRPVYNALILGALKKYAI